MPGIQSLMSGQAPMPGMMPKPSAATPASVVAQLNAQLSSNPEQRLQQLLQMYAQKPTLALLSQVSEATNAVELKKKQQQQDYMAAFAQQGPQTVADMVKQRAQQVAQQPVMAAQGGIMQGYAGGGAVAFQYGGRTLGFAPDYELARKYGINLSPYDSPAVREEKIKRARAMADLDTGKLAPFGPPESPMMDVPEVQVAAPRSPGATRPGTGQARPQRQPAATPDAGIASVNPYRGLTFNPDTAVGPEVTQRTGLASLEAADLEAAQKRLTQDPTVKAAQDALLQNMQGTADTRRARAQQQLDEVLKRGRTSVFEDPEALLRIAGGIDTRRGRGIGSLASGIAGVMGERRKEAADAKTLFNKEMDALDTMKQLQLERDLLIKQGRVTEAQAAEDKLRAVRKEYEGIRYNREVKQAEEARQQFIAESGRISAEAAQKQAEAAMKSANARAAGGREKGTITQRDLAKYRMDAEKQVEKLLPEDREYRKLRNDPTAQADYRENKIKAKVREALIAAGYELPAGYERPTTATAATPTTNDPLGIRK